MLNIKVNKLALIILFLLQNGILLLDHNSITFY